MQELVSNYSISQIIIFIILIALAIKGLIEWIDWANARGKQHYKKQSTISEIQEKIKTDLAKILYEEGRLSELSLSTGKMNDDSSAAGESVVTASSDEIIDPEVEVSKQTAEIPGADDIPVDEIVDENKETDRIIEDTADFNISDVFDEDMFNADFSNPNDGISIDDIVDPDSFEELEEKQGVVETWNN